MKMKFTKSIGFKVALVTAVGLWVVITVFSLLNIKMTESMLLDTARTEASKTSDAIKHSLESAMLSNDDALITSTIRAIGQNPAVKHIEILSPEGVVKWAREPSEVGRVLDKTRDRGCGICHQGETVRWENLTVLFQKKDGERILRNVNPIENKPGCYECHEPGEKVLGKLLLDFTTEDIDATVERSRKMLMLSAAITLAVAVFMCIVLFNRLVGVPLFSLLGKMKEVEEGKRDAEVAVRGDDEIAELGREFNRMMASVRAAEQEVDQRMEEHLALFNVADILNRSDSVEEAGELISHAISIGFHVEQSAIMLFDESGGLRVQTALGFDEEQAGLVRDYIETSGVKEKIMDGEIFVAEGAGEKIEKFLVMPLKAAKKVLGAITVHRIKDRSVDSGDVRRLLSIVAGAFAPHFLIGQQFEGKRAMMAGPFNSFVESVDEEMDKAREYQGALTLAVLTVENYGEVCKSEGVERASALVKEAGASISGAIEEVHESTRLKEDKIAVILPLVDKSRAREIIDKALDAQGDGIMFKVAMVSYPEDGRTALELVHALRGQA